MRPDDSSRRKLLRWWAWFAFATLIAGALLSLRYVASAGPAGSALAAWARVLNVTGQVASLATFMLLPVLALATLLPRPRLVLVVGTIISSLMLGFLLIDSQVYGLYRFHLNPGVLHLVAGGAGSQIFVFPMSMYLQALGIGLAVIAWQGAVAAWLWRRIDVARRPLLRGGVVAVALGGLIVTYQLTQAWADAVGFTPVTRDTLLLPLSYPIRARGVFRSMGIETRRDEWHLGESDATLAYPLEPLQCKRPEPARNIVFIIIDSWRFDALNAGVTPNIARFAQGAARFGQQFSGGNATRAGIFSLFYAVPATYWQDMLQRRRGPVFISTLLEEGYEIGIFQSASLRSPEFHETVFAGIEHPRMESDGDRPAARDRDLTDDFEAFLAGQQRSRPFFAYLFYDSPHAYDFPADFPLTFTPSLEQVNYLALGPHSDPVPFRNRYLNSVRYVDTLVGEVLDHLRESGQLGSSVVVITSDHGQEFNDSGLGFWGHNSNYMRFQTQVPLLVFASDISPADYSYRTSHFDLVPTLMSRYLGCTTPMDRYSVGHDLFQAGGRDRLVVGSYQDFAVLGPDRIISVKKTGIVMQDADGRPAIGQGPDAAAVATATEQNSRFRLRGRPGG